MCNKNDFELIFDSVVSHFCLLILLYFSLYFIFTCIYGSCNEFIVVVGILRRYYVIVAEEGRLQRKERPCFIPDTFCPP